jgi:hypothetical protein
VGDQFEIHKGAVHFEIHKGAVHFGAGRDNFFRL